MSLTLAEHIEISLKRALAYYDKGDHENAVKSFMTDMGKEECSRKIAEAGDMSKVILEGGLSSRSTFIQTARGFVR